jgi:hypothetical protein
MEIKYSYVDLLDSIDQHVHSLMLNKSFIKMLGIYLGKEGRVCAVTIIGDAGGGRVLFMATHSMFEGSGQQYSTL